MNLTLFVAPDCCSCEQVQKKLIELVNSNPKLLLHVSDIEKDNPKNLVIVPALYVEDELFAYGEFDINRLNSYIKLST